MENFSCYDSFFSHLTCSQVRAGLVAARVLGTVRYRRGGRQGRVQYLRRRLPTAPSLAERYFIYGAGVPPGGSASEEIIQRDRGGRTSKEACEGVGQRRDYVACRIGGSDPFSLEHREDPMRSMSVPVPVPVPRLVLLPARCYGDVLVGRKVKQDVETPSLPWLGLQPS
jgi:hypothetical protein